jgi:hypothetical protein
MKEGIMKCKKHGTIYDTKKVGRCLRCNLDQKEKNKLTRLLKSYE